jgi:hypothetical protein
MTLKVPSRPFKFKIYGALGNSFFKVCVKFQLNRSPFGSVSHSKTEFRATENITR